MILRAWEFQDEHRRKIHTDLPYQSGNNHLITDSRFQGRDVRLDGSGVYRLIDRIVFHYFIIHSILDEIDF